LSRYFQHHDKLPLETDLQERNQVKIRRYWEDHAVFGTAFAPAIVLVAGQIHPEFLRLLEVLADKQTHNFYALTSTEEEIGGESFTWSQARTFSFNKKSIGKAFTYATATRLLLSVNGTPPTALCQAGQPTSSAECLMHGAAHASHRAPPRPAVNVDGGAHSVEPSVPATDPGSFGEVDVVADDTLAAGGVAAADWLAATFSGGDLNAIGTGACASDVNDGLFPGLEGRDNIASPSSCLRTLPDDDDDITPLLSPYNATPGGSSGF